MKKILIMKVHNDVSLLTDQQIDLLKQFTLAGMDSEETRKRTSFEVIEVEELSFAERWAEEIKQYIRKMDKQS